MFFFNFGLLNTEAMSDREREEFIIILEKQRKELSKDPVAARKFLIDAGIYTSKGNLRKPYKNLCIPQNPA
jgi:hypothetical protein